MRRQIGEAIRHARALFEPVSDSARLDAELLLAHCLEKPRSYLYSWPEETLSESVWQQFDQLIQQRLKPTPVAYLLGEREFYSLNFRTTPVALIPRPETEMLVDTVLQLCADMDRPRILEMGTGTGAISITLLKQRKDIELVTTDINADCLTLARENASLHKVDLYCFESDWFENLEGLPAFDLIVSNPPYIAANDPYLAHGDLPAEPALALTPGQTGLEAIEKIIQCAPGFLKEGGSLVFEHGHDQALKIESLLQQSGFESIHNLPDYNNLPRVSYATLPCK